LLGVWGEESIVTDATKDRVAKSPDPTDADR
jgi:hypothetical protein